MWDESFGGTSTDEGFTLWLETKIGEMQTRLGVVPLNLSEVRIDPTLSDLATTDWFRAGQIVNDIREPSLRLLLKLQFAGALLAKELKSKKSQAAPKRFEIQRSKTAGRPS